MPHAVTHVLIAIVILELIRDYIIKDKKKFSLHYILIAGIAATIPDWDIALGWLGVNIAHRTISHSLIIPLALLIIGFALKSGKSKLKPRLVLMAISYGMFMHVILDALVLGTVMPLYPLSQISIGLNLVSLIKIPAETLIPAIDALVLIAWLVHEELRHKISSFY